MEKYSAHINSIVQNSEQGYEIKITIYNEGEFELLFDKTRDKQFNLNAKTYILHINGNTMSFPSGDEINEIMDVYHEYEFSNNLNPTLRRQWKTGNLVDEIAYRLISSGILCKISEDDINNDD